MFFAGSLRKRLFGITVINANDVARMQHRFHSHPKGSCVHVFLKTERDNTRSFGYEEGRESTTFFVTTDFYGFIDFFFVKVLAIIFVFEASSISKYNAYVPFSNFVVVVTAVVVGGWSRCCCCFVH